MGTVNVVIDGYDHTRTDWFEIESVRTFIHCLDQEFPYWLFVCSLHTTSLQKIAKCFLPPFLTEDEQREQFPAQLNDLLSERWLPALREVADVLDMTEPELHSRADAAASYLTFNLLGEPSPEARSQTAVDLSSVTVGTLHGRDIHAEGEQATAVHINGGTFGSLNLQDVSARHYMSHDPTSPQAAPHGSTVSPPSTTAINMSDVQANYMVLGVAQHHHYAPQPVTEKLVIGDIPTAPPGFVERGEQQEVASILSSDSAARICALIGMRGAGKSQIAAAYAQQCINAGIDVVVWLNAETEWDLSIGLVDLAEKLGVPSPDGDPARAARRVREHLAARPGTKLLIFDNASNPDRLHHQLTSWGSTRILLTSTDRQFGEIGAAVEVGPYRREQSIAYLRERTALDASLATVEICEQLGDLPLALTAAAATIRARSYSYQDYLHVLDKSVTQALDRRPGLGYPLRTERALSLSIDTLLQDDPSGEARELLQIMSLLSPHKVAKVLLSRIVLATPNTVEAAMEHCVRGSILTEIVGAKALGMHHLIGRIVRERWIENTEYHKLVASTTAALLQDLKRDTDTTDTATILAAAAHAETLWGSVLRANCQQELIESTLMTRVAAVARLIDRSSNLGSVLHLGIQVVHDCEEKLGHTHQLSFIARQNLARAYEISGQLDVAATMLEDLIADQKNDLGDDHRRTLATRTHLAQILCAAGDLPRGIELLEQSVNAYARTLDGSHRDALTARVGLAVAQRLAGHTDIAIALYEQLLLDCDDVPGGYHEVALAVRNNLAVAHRDVGNHAAAITLLESVTQDTVELLGPDHPLSFASRTNLAGAYKDTGQLQRAIALHECNLSDRETLLGARHPATMITRNNLADTYDSAGELGRARDLHERNLRYREDVLGPDHPHTQISRSNFAGVLLAHGETARAVEILEQIVVHFERTLAPDHPNLFVARNNLAAGYEQAGHPQLALPLYEQCFADRHRVLGIQHQHTRESLDYLAEAYLEAGRPNEAISLRILDLDRCQSTTSESHPDTLAAANALAIAYVAADCPLEALQISQTTLVRSMTTLGSKSPVTHEARTIRDFAHRLLNEQNP